MNPCKILGSITGLIVFGTPAAVAQMTADHTPSPDRFQRVEQPLGVKVGVATGGLALIGLELWWFLSKSKAQRSSIKQGVQTVAIDVDRGYEPSQVVVQAGQGVSSILLIKIKLTDY